MNDSARRDAAQRALVTVGVAVAVLVALVLLWYALDVVLLAFAGVLLAILLRAPADWLAARTRLPPGAALALVGAALLALAGAAAVLFGRTVLGEALQLFERVPEVIDHVRARLAQSEFGHRLLGFLEASGALSGGELQALSRGLGLLGSTFGVLANFVIVVFFAAFMAATPALYLEGLLALVPPRRRRRAREVLREIGRVLRRWLVGQSVLALLVALAVGTGLALLGAPFALALALLAGLMEFVPYLGPLIAALPALLVAFAQEPQLALWVAALYLGVQSLESYLLAPLVHQRAVHLPPALVLFAQVLMGVVVGGLGVALATPLAAALLVAVSMLYIEDALGDKA